MKTKKGSVTIILSIIIVFLVIVLIGLIFYFNYYSDGKDSKNNSQPAERLTKQDHIDFCNNKPDTESKRNCFQFVAESFGDKELCDSAKFTDRCNEKIELYAKENIEECEEYSAEKTDLELKSQREKCYGFASVYLEDFKGCEKGWPNSIGDCKITIAAKIGLLDLCDEISIENKGFQSTCYSFVAYYRDDPQICNLLVDTKIKNDCIEHNSLLTKFLTK